MKKKSILLAGIVMSQIVLAQVGINTNNPQGLFHINGGSTGQSDTDITNDVLIRKSDGNVSIGHISPTVKLHVKTTGTAAAPVTALRIEDGSQATNYVLTSIDGNGNAQWKPAQTSTTVISQGVATKFGFNGAGVDIPFKTSGSTFYKTGSYVDLPYGTWQVTVNMLLAVDVIPSTMTANDWVWMKSSFSKVNATTITDSQITTDFVSPGPVYGSALFNGPKLVNDQPKFNILRGTFIIKNNDAAATDTNPTRYWYYGGLVDSQEYTTGAGKATKFTKFGGYWGEDVITAVRIL